MEAVIWQQVAGWIVTGVAGGALFWLLAQPALLVAERLPRKRLFDADLLSSAGDRDRRQHRILGRKLAVLLAAFLVALVVSAMLAAAGTFPVWPTWASLITLPLSAAVITLGIYGIVRLTAARRRARFAWAARAVIGGVLERLNFSGHRVFHEVGLEGSIIDHVVVGARGVFAVNVVPYPAPKGASRPVAELKNGKLRLDGDAQALPVGEAARNMTLLAGALSKIVGHRVPVRSVLAVPGWQSVPSGSANHLVLHENNLVTLTSWNTPDAYLMDEDCLSIQDFLVGASRSMD